MKPQQKSIAILIFFVAIMSGLVGVLGNHIELDIPHSWQPFIVPFFLFALVVTGVVAVWQWMQSDQSDPQSSSSPGTPHDPFASYDIGITTLLQRLGTDHPRYSEALVYEQRLRENIAHARRYGNDLANQTQRNEIIDRLNSLARDTLTTSFNALCPASSAVSDLDRRNRTRMLENVHDYWIKGILEQSLYREMLIDLGMEYNPDAVQYPWDMVLHRPNRVDTTLPANTRMIDVFTEARGELLILGAPGAGKTTMLLDLARTLVAQAQQDETLPIPVVFTLSTWATFVEKQKQATLADSLKAVFVKKQQQQQATLADWLVQELHQRYSVPKKTAQALVDQHQIRPLLDGLDEVKQQHRASCVEAINGYRTEHGSNGIVVCSRIADYEAIQARLEVREAVTLQPLQNQQIDDYLAQAGDEVAAVRTLLRDDADMRELADTPLMLSIMVLAYKGMPAATLPDTGTRNERRTHLFDRYVQQMFKRGKKEHRSSDEKTVQWLSWLAARMVEHGHTVLYLEQMQPTWLQKAWQRWGYRVVIGLIIGIISMTLGGFLGLLTGSIPGFFRGLSIGMFIGIFVGWQSTQAKIETVEKFHWSWSSFGYGLVITTVIAGTIWFLFERGIGIIGGTGIALLFTIIFTLVLLVINGLSKSYRIPKLDQDLSKKPNQKIWEALHNSIKVVLIFVFIGMGSVLSAIFLFAQKLPSYELVEWTKTAASSLLSISLIIGLIYGSTKFGGLAFIQHFTLRAILAINKNIPLNLVPFLDYAKDRILLRRVGNGYMFIHRTMLEYFVEIHYTYTIEQTSDNATIYRQRGDFYATLGRYDNAIADYTSAIERNPKDIELYNKRGKISAMQSLYEQAISDFSHVIEMRPKDHLSYYRRGYEYINQRAYKQAIDDISSAIELTPKTKKDVLFYVLARSKFNVVEISDLQEEYISLLYKMTWTLGRFGTLNGLADDEIICDFCAEIVSLEPDNGLYRDTRGLNRALRGDYAGAIEDFQSFIAWARQEQSNDTNKIKQRNAWIEALQRGENPFDEATLAELRKEIM